MHSFEAKAQLAFSIKQAALYSTLTPNTHVQQYVLGQEVSSGVEQKAPVREPWGVADRGDVQAVLGTMEQRNWC